MRRILIETVRHKRARKHGGGMHRWELADADLAVDCARIDILALSEALDLWCTLVYAGRMTSIRRTDVQACLCIAAGAAFVLSAGTEFVSYAGIKSKRSLASAWSYLVGAALWGMGGLHLAGIVNLNRLV
jgi:hypothetical protein